MRQPIIDPSWIICSFLSILWWCNGRNMTTGVLTLSVYVFTLFGRSASGERVCDPGSYDSDTILIYLYTLLNFISHHASVEMWTGFFLPPALVFVCFCSQDVVMENKWVWNLKFWYVRSFIGLSVFQVRSTGSQWFTSQTCLKQSHLVET